MQRVGVSVCTERSAASCCACACTSADGDTRPKASTGPADSEKRERAPRTAERDRERDGRDSDGTHHSQRCPASSIVNRLSQRRGKYWAGERVVSPRTTYVRRATHGRVSEASRGVRECRSGAAIDLHRCGPFLRIRVYGRVHM